MKGGSYFPGTAFSSLFAMAGDDCSLHFDLDDLSDKQQADHLSNIELTAMLQVALACIGHDNDHLALYDENLKPEWQETLKTYHVFFRQMVAATVPMEHFSYHPKFDYYKSVAKLAAENPNLTDVINLYMVSGSNAGLHRDEKLLNVSRNVNSKVHFAENAPGYGIPTPDTLVCTKAELTGDGVKDFFARHDNQVMLKLLGLAGARNVTAVTSIAESLAYVVEYDDDMIIILQEQLSLDRFTEMTVDLFVSDTEIRIANIRKILFAEGLWVGNLIGEGVGLTAEQESILLKVGEYARSHGYTSAEGSNCGIDYFLKDDGSVIVTEINARWTGGLFPAEILEQVETNGRDAVAFFDLVSIEKRAAYLEFLERYLVGSFEGEFAMIPIGFGCFEIDMEGTPFFYTWQIVLGDLEVFKATKSAELGGGAMPTADLIRLD